MSRRRCKKAEGGANKWEGANEPEGVEMDGERFKQMGGCTDK
jgi:hypothetical protein